MNQHWYHCHTCKMIDRVGVCSVCARVCHKGHDVTYAKYGNFFCDCGARESGSCQVRILWSEILFCLISILLKTFIIADMTFRNPPNTILFFIFNVWLLI